MPQPAENRQFNTIALTFCEKGTMHEQYQIPNQDAFRSLEENGWQIAVVCDGVSLKPDMSFSQSEIASEFCAKTAASLLKEKLQENPEADQPHLIMDDVFSQTLEALKKELKEQNIPFQDCQTTMIACIYKDGIIHCGLAGDGGAVLQYANDELGLLVTRLKTNSYVLPLAITEAWKFSSAGSAENPVKAVLLATDGIFDALAGIDEAGNPQADYEKLMQIFGLIDKPENEAREDFDAICRSLPGSDDKTAILLLDPDAKCEEVSAANEKSENKEPESQMESDHVTEADASRSEEEADAKVQEESQKWIPLNTGAKMPMVGFGVYKIKDPLECEQAVINALQAGYRLIDTASVYGNEEAVGNAIKKSGIPRDEIFLTTKIWIQDFGYENCRKAIDQALERLQTGYVDLMLIHHPQMDCIGAYRALEEAYHQKKCRAIGVSNFYPYRLLDFIYSTKVMPAVNQVELSPYFAQADAIEFMQEQGIVPQAWAPLAQNRFGLLDEPVLQIIAKAYGKTPAQIALRWNIQRGVAVVVKSSNPQRMKENLEIFDFELTDEEMAAITRLSLSKSRIEDPFDLDFVRAHDTRKIHD